MFSTVNLTWSCLLQEAEWNVSSLFSLFHLFQRPFLTLTTSPPLLLKQLLLIRLQPEALKRWRLGGGGSAEASMTQIAFHSSAPSFSFFLPHLDSAVSTLLHLQSDLCYSSLWFLRVQRRQDVSNWKGCDGAGGPLLGAWRPPVLERSVSHTDMQWHLATTGL